MALSNPLIRNVLGRYVYPMINTARNLFSDTGRILTTLALFAKSVTLGCGSNFFPSIVEEMRMKLNSDTETISKIFKIFALMSMVGSIAGIFIFKKIRRQLGTMYVLVGISVSMIMIPNCPGVDSFFIAIGIFGALVGMIVPGQIVWTMEMWQKQSTPILQALMFFFSVGMSLPEYITAPFLKPVILNATDIGELEDLLINGTSLDVPATNKTIGQFLQTIKDSVIQASANGPPELSNIHIPFAIVGVMAFFNAWFERLLFKHYTYAPPAPPPPPPKPGAEVKPEDKGDKKDKDPKAMAMKQLKNMELPHHSSVEEELGEEEEEEEEDDEVEHEEEEEDEDQDEDEDDAGEEDVKRNHTEESEDSEEKEDDDDDDDDEGNAESEKMPMLKRQASEKIPTVRKQMPMLKKHQSMMEAPAEKSKMPGRRSSMTLPGPTKVVAEVRNVMNNTLPPLNKASSGHKSIELPTSQRKQSLVKQSSEEKAPTAKSPSTRMLSEKKPSISAGSCEKILEEKLEKPLPVVETKPTEPREGRSLSTITRQESKGGLSAGRKRSTSRTRVKRTKSQSSQRKGKKKSFKKGKKGKKGDENKKDEEEEIVQDDLEEEQADEEEIDADLCDQPLLPSAGESEKEGGIDLFNINSDDDAETGHETGLSTRASTVNNDGEEEATGDTEEVSEFSDDEEIGRSIAPPTTCSSRENVLSDTESHKVVSSKASVKSSKDKLGEEVKASDKEGSVAGEDATPRSTLSSKSIKKKKKKDEEEEEPIVEKDKVTSTKEAPVPEDKKKEEDAGGSAPPSTVKGKKSKKDDDEEIKSVEKDVEAPPGDPPAEDGGGAEDAEGGSPVQKIIKKIKGLKKIGIALWNMLRDPDQRRGLIVIALSSVFFGAYAAIEKCSKDLIPGLGQEGNLKLDDDGGALILKGFTMAFMIGRLAGMVIALKISPFLLLCSDLALVFLGNFMLIFGASFSEQIMLVGSVFMGLGLSTIYAGLFTYLCGVIPFTDAVGSILIVASTIATSVYANFIEGFISGNSQRLTSANYISGLACTLAFKLIYSITKPKKTPPPPLENVVSVR